MTNRAKSIICFIFFTAILIKDFLVDYLHVIPVRSPANRVISWFIIFPLTIIGTFIALQVLKEIFLNRKSKIRIADTINLLLSIPVLLSGLYLASGLGYILFFARY